MISEAQFKPVEVEREGFQLFAFLKNNHRNRQEKGKQEEMVLFPRFLALGAAIAIVSNGATRSDAISIALRNPLLLAAPLLRCDSSSKFMGRCNEGFKRMQMRGSETLGGGESSDGELVLRRSSLEQAWGARQMVRVER